jgi:tetratricopeptide (TPR) repeat protein
MSTTPDPGPPDAGTVLALIADARSDAALTAARGLMLARAASPLAIREVTALLSLADLLAADARPGDAIDLCRFVAHHAGMDAHAKAAARRIEALDDASRHDDLAAGIAQLSTVGDAIAAAKRHGRHGESGLAVAAAQRAVALTESKRTLNQLAATYRQAGRVADAEQTYRASLAASGEAENAPAALGLATILVDRGESAEALRLADAAIAVEPDAVNAPAHALRGRILLQLSRVPEAEQAFASAFVARNAQARRHLEELRDGYEDQGDHRSAQRLDRILDTEST